MGALEQETQEALTRGQPWAERHPWLSPLLVEQDEEDSVGEVIRYTLDELRLA